MSDKKSHAASRRGAIDVSGSSVRARSRKAERDASAADPIAVDRPSAPAASVSDRVRHRFAISQAEYELLSVLKARMSWIDRPTKRGELLRAGLVALSSLSDAELKDAVDRLPKLKTGSKKR